MRIVIYVAVPPFDVNDKDFDFSHRFLESGNLKSLNNVSIWVKNADGYVDECYGSAWPRVFLTDFGRSMSLDELLEDIEAKMGTDDLSLLDEDITELDALNFESEAEYDEFMAEYDI